MSTYPDRTTDARARLLSHFAQATGTTEHGARWDALWKESFLPWDKGFPNPALVDLLAERQDILPSPRHDGKKLKALVPGCGKGYDVLLLASWGYEAYGLEIASTALEAARKVEAEMSGQKEYETKREGGSVTWLSGDFFEDGFLKNVQGEGKFDLIYDYTFLCALPPTMRPAWSKRYNDLLSPSGRVICVEFPTYKPPSTGGPPWALPPKIYNAHLPRPGEELSYADDGELLEDKIGEPIPGALRRVEHFQPKRTHKIGYSADGKVTDWVSVWSFET